MSVDASPEARAVPEPGSDPSATGVRRRRRLRWSALVLLLAVAGAVTGGLVWARHYQPLVVGSGPTGAVSDDVRVVDDSNVLGAQYTLVRPSGGDTATARLTIAVADDAPFGVTVDDVGIPAWLVGNPRHVGYVDSVEVSMRRMPPPGDQPLVPFTPVTLGPGDYLELRLSMTFAECGSREPGTTWTGDVALSYTALGMTHRIAMPLGYALALRDAGQCGLG